MVNIRTNNVKHNLLIIYMYMMGHLSYLVMLLSLITLNHQSVEAATTTRVVARAPMNPVNVNAILSVHCQIWHLQKGDRVSLFRTLPSLAYSNAELLSVNENVIQSIEERIFLAVRTMVDGSSSYFLSVAGVKQSDQGDYECKVLRGYTPIAGDIVSVRVNYYPVEPPVCTPSGPRMIRAGVLTQFNCTTGIGSPEVRIRWSRTRDIQPGILESNQGTVGDKSYSELAVVLTPTDKGAVFLCEVTSPVFPEIKKTCVVGPLTILKSDNTGQSKPYPTTAHKTDNAHDYKQDGTTRQIDIASKTKCCSTFSSPVFQWMVASVIAGIIALSFCIAGVFLVIKYNRILNARKKTMAVVSSAQSSGGKVEGIYDEVDVKPYMTLQRQPLQLQTMPDDKDMQFVGYYRFAPKPVCS